MTETIDQPFEFKRGRGSVLIIACGALGREIVQLIRVNRWSHLDVSCLPARLHHTPALIPDAVAKKIRECKEHYRKLYVMYGDCGTGGRLDKVLESEGVERIPGPHCFAFYAGNDHFDQWAEDDIRTFYLTDFFCRHFEKFVWQALGLDRREDMVGFVFAHYKNVVYLAQTEDPMLLQQARVIAGRLDLEFEYRLTGYGEMAAGLSGLPIMVNSQSR